MDAELMLERFGEALREIVREELRAGLIPQPSSPEVLSLKEAARRLSCSESTVRRLARAGQLVLVRVGETPKVPVSEVRRLCTPSPAMPEQGRPVKRTQRHTAAMPEASPRAKRYSVAAEKARLAELRAKRKR